MLDSFWSLAKESRDSSSKVQEHHAAMDISHSEYQKLVKPTTHNAVPSSDSSDSSPERLSFGFKLELFDGTTEMQRCSWLVMKMQLYTLCGMTREKRIKK